MVIDGKSDNKIKYNVVGGEQVFGYHVEIYDNTTNALIFYDKVFSFVFEINVYANILTNGTEYKIRVRTFNEHVDSTFSNIDTYSSAFSDFSIMKCFTTPVVTINNLLKDTSGNDMIKNQTFEFSGQYSQTENVSLKSFRYLLYDKNRILLQSYSEKFQLSGNLLQEITGLTNNETYFVELLTINQYDVQTSSGLIQFYVQYIKPKIAQTLKAEVDKENASIRVEAKIVRVLFKGSGYTFDTNDTINVINGSISIDEESNFHINDNFTLKLWVSNIIDNNDFLYIYNSEGKIRLHLQNGRIHAYKEYNDLDIYSHYASELLGTYTNSTLFYIFLQQVGGMLDIKFEKI
jgi:hypothetical protein